MYNTSDTWIAVTDGKVATFLSYQGRRQPPIELDFDFPENDCPQTQEMTSDKPGRSFNSADSRRSAMEPRTDPHEYEKQRYALKVGQFLNRHVNEFNRIILISAPKHLGYIRKALSKNVQAKVMLEIDKDLTHTPIKDLNNHILPYLP